MISLDIHRRKITLPAQLQGLITGASERKVLRRVLDRQLLPQLAYQETLALTISEPTLTRMVTKYSEQLVFQPLAPAAKEMSGLTRKLIESKGRKRIGEKTPVSTVDARRHYDVLELGLLESVQGLLAIPAPDVGALDVDGIRQAYPTEGDWFPFEVRVDDLLFVIDDDGSLFISTENFPRDVLGRAKLALHHLAEKLYS
jgi:hypothetical protein